MADLIKPKTVLENAANKMQNVPKQKNAYTMGTTGRLLRDFVMVQHDLNPDLVQDKMINKLAVAEMGIAQTQDKISTDKYGISDILHRIEDNVASLGTKKDTSSFYQQFTQQLPSQRDGVQNIANEKNRLKDVSAEFRAFIYQKIHEAIVKAKEALASGKSRDSVKSEFSQELNSVLNSIEVKKKEKALNADVGKLDLNETSLSQSLARLEQETRTIAAAAGIKVTAPAPGPHAGGKV